MVEVLMLAADGTAWRWCLCVLVSRNNSSGYGSGHAHNESGRCCGGCIDSGGYGSSLLRMCSCHIIGSFSPY